MSHRDDEHLAAIHGRSFHVSSLNRWLKNDTLLFWFYIAFVTGCVVPSFQPLTNPLFLLIVPLVFLHVAHLDILRSPPELRVSATLSFWRIQKITRVGSVILCAAGLYLLMVTLSSLLQPTIGPTNVIPLLVISLEIIGFLVVTALLVSSSKDRCNLCLAVLAVIAGANALGLIIRDLATIPFDQFFFPDYYLAYAPMPPGQTSLRIICSIFLVASIAILREGVKSLWCRVPLIASALILTCAVLLTQGRGIILAVAVGVATTFNWSIRSILLPVGALALILTLVFTIPTTRDRILERGDSRRPEIWSHYIDYSSKRPWLGYGMIDGLDPGIAFRSKDGTYIAHAHNLILSAQVRGGVLATGSMIVMLLGGLYYSRRYAQLTGKRAPLAIIATLFVSGIFEYDTFIRSFPNWQTVSFWLPIGICSGTEIYVRSRHGNNFEKRRGADRRPLPDWVTTPSSQSHAAPKFE